MSTPAEDTTADVPGEADSSVAAPTVTTILDRMRSAGLSEDRARERLTRTAVHVEGQAVSDPATPAPWPARWVINPA